MKTEAERKASLIAKMARLDRLDAAKGYTTPLAAFRAERAKAY